MRQQRTANQLRCFCRRKPLLAVYGLDENGRVYLHIKIFKQDRIFGEILVTEGIVKMHCRDCLRWHTVRIKPSGVPFLEEAPDPVELAGNASPTHA